ncbi:sulfotransferase 1C4-like [Tachypleus tridentatus]|uniref:sulfotransferase 1C4-like n=1 Tax=Tachypleus tridentatus TaxID=6853 RepID=UPI003FD3A0C1
MKLGENLRGNGERKYNMQKAAQIKKSHHVTGNIAGRLEDEITDFMKPQTQLIDGLFIPKGLFKEDRVRAAMRFQPKPGDVIIVTYPKCGTTWTQYIVWEILNEGATPPQVHEMFNNEIPFLELTGTEAVEHIPPPRAFKVHFPFAYTPYSSKCKYIVVVRNPWDCCVLYFFHTKQLVFANQFEEGTFDDFFE